MKNSKLCEYRLKDAQSITNRKKTDRCGPPIIYCALRWAHTASCSPVTVQPGIRVRLEESVPDLFKLTTRHPFPPCIQLSPNSHRSLVKYYILHPFIKILSLVSLPLGLWLVSLRRHLPSPSTFWVMFDHSSYSKLLYILLWFVLSLNKVQTQLIFFYIWINILNKMNDQT
jgi:hypothetical protein